METTKTSRASTGFNVKLTRDDIAALLAARRGKPYGYAFFREQGMHRWYGPPSNPWTVSVLRDVVIIETATGQGVKLDAGLGLPFQPRHVIGVLRAIGCLPPKAAQR